MTLVAFQQKKKALVCIVGKSAINSKRHVHPLPSQSHSSTSARRHPAISRFVARRCGHAALLSHSCLGVCERCCPLIFFCILFISYLSHAALSLAVSRCTLSPSLHTGGTAASLAGATRRARPWGRGQLLQQRGVGQPRLAAPWSGGRRGGLTGGVAGRSPAPPCRLLLLLFSPPW